MDIKDNLRSLRKSFSYAIRGINYCILNERNMRIHLAVTLFVLSFAYCYKTTQFELIALLLCFGLVISCEMVNTSIETIINLSSPSYNNLAKITKDVSAGAVLVTAIISIAVGIVIFFDCNRLYNTYIYIINNNLVIAYFIILILGCLIFIFKYPLIYHTKIKRK